MCGLKKQTEKIILFMQTKILEAGLYIKNTFYCIALYVTYFKESHEKTLFEI